MIVCYPLSSTKCGFATTLDVYEVGQTLAHIHSIDGYLVNGSARIPSSDGFQVIECDLLFPTINPWGNLMVGNYYMHR